MEENGEVAGRLKLKGSWALVLRATCMIERTEKGKQQVCGKKGGKHVEDKTGGRPLFSPEVWIPCAFSLAKVSFGIETRVDLKFLEGWGITCEPLAIQE